MLYSVFLLFRKQLSPSLRDSISTSEEPRVEASVVVPPPLLNLQTCVQPTLQHFSLVNVACTQWDFKKISLLA